MGGFGSGDYERVKSARMRVEEHESIDSFEIAQLLRDTGSGCLGFASQESDSLFVYAEQEGSRWLVWASLIDRSMDDPALWPAMKTVEQSQGSEMEGVRAAWKRGDAVKFPFATVYAPQRIMTETTTSPAGASCEWFVCPRLKNGMICERRCRKLYWRGASFACRQCCELAYTTQNLRLRERLLKRAERLREKVLERLTPVEAAPCRSQDDLFPPAPPRMSYVRYMSLHDEWDGCRREAERLWKEEMRRNIDAQSRQADEHLKQQGLSTEYPHNPVPKRRRNRGRNKRAKSVGA